MKFRFIITDTLNGSIVGTNSEEAARQFAESEDFFVFDSMFDLWIGVGGQMLEVKEIKL